MHFQTGHTKFFSSFKSVFSGLIFSLTCLPSLSQLPSANITETFQDHAIKNIQEKIYVQLDRVDHLTGEILWFKIYCIDGLMHLPLDVSKIAYVEILDKDNRSLLMTKVALGKGVGSGSFFLPSTLESGKYLFRAYTNWMKNNKPEYYFQKSITIINTLKANETTLPVAQETSMDVQFFPEGGYLIEGVQSKIGFKAIDFSGLGVNCRGALINQANDTVARFNTLKFGIGRFVFTPRANQTYRAIVFNKSGEALSFNFPEIRKSGYSLMVADVPDGKIKVTVTNPDGILAIQLFIHTRQSVKISDLRTTRDKTCEFLVDKEKLGDGISHITIFNHNGDPVCERLYFKKPLNIFALNVEADQNEYSTRRKVQLNINSKQPYSGNLSISVFRDDSVASNENIINYFLLTSDLTGHIESPGYYFSEQTDAHEAVDNLMLTQGWRRFKWADVLDKTKSGASFHPEINGHLIRGQVMDNKNNPVAGKVVYLAIPGKKLNLYISRSDSSGMIQFQIRDFQETGKIIAQTNYAHDSLNHIKIESPFSNNHVKWISRPLLLDRTMEAELTKRSLSMQVQDAFFEDETYFNYKKNETDSIPFYGQADEVYALDDYTRFPELEEVMREYIKGVWVRKRGDNFRFLVSDKLRNEIFKEEPLTLLDGIPIFDINQLMKIDPLKINTVQVTSRKYFYGPLEFQGIISLSTFMGDLAGFQLDPQSITLDYEGLQSHREFFSPRYTSPELRGSRLPDQRHQLYWNPDAKLVQGKSTSIEFYTSDVEGNYTIVVEGISTAGHPGSSVISFKVSR